MRSEKQRRVLVELLGGPRTRDQLMSAIGGYVSTQLMRQLVVAGFVFRGQTDEQLDQPGDDGRVVQWSLSERGRGEATKLAEASKR